MASSSMFSIRLHQFRPVYSFIANYFTSATIVMNNKSVALDDTLANNAFYEKYKAKITALQQ